MDLVIKKKMLLSGIIWIQKREKLITDKFANDQKLDGSKNIRW